MRSALARHRVGGDRRGRKCTPLMTPSVLSTRSHPGGGANRGGIVGETERAGMGGDRPEISRDQAVLARLLIHFRHRLLPTGVRLQSSRALPFPSLKRIATRIVLIFRMISFRKRRQCFAINNT